MINASIGSNIVEPSATLSESKPISIESPKKKSKNGILIGIIVLLILAVAGAFVYLKFFSNISHKGYPLAI